MPHNHFYGFIFHDKPFMNNLLSCTLPVERLVLIMTLRSKINNTFINNNKKGEKNMGPFI